MEQQAGDSIHFVKLSDSAQGVLARAQDYSALYLHRHVEPEHVFLALLRDEDNSARSIFEALKVSVDRLANDFDAYLYSLPAAAGAQREYSARTLALLSRCQAEALSLKLHEIRPALLLIALAQEEQGFLANRLREHGVHKEMLATIAEAQRRLEAEFDQHKPPPEGSPVQAPAQESSKMDFYNFFSFSGKKAIFRASEICEQFNNQYLEPEHIFYSILNLRSCSAVQVLHQLNINLPKLTYTLEAYLYEHAGSYKGPPQFGKRTINLLDTSFAEVKRLQHREIGTTHLLIALARDRTTFLDGLCAEHVITAKLVTDAFIAHLKGFGQAAPASGMPGIASEIKVKREGQGSEQEYHFRLSQILDCGDGFGAHFNSEALLALALAASTARRLRHAELLALHVVLGLISLPFDPQRSLMEKLGVDSAMLLAGLYRLLGKEAPGDDYCVPQLSDDGVLLLEKAFGHATRRRTGCITALHLLLACMDSAAGELKELMDSAGLSMERMEELGRSEAKEGAAEPAADTQTALLSEKEQLIHDAREMSKHSLNIDYLKDMGMIVVPEDMASEPGSQGKAGGEENEDDNDEQADDEPAAEDAAN